jgi:hypothetical protein
MRKLWLLLIWVALVAGCRSDAGFATLTANAPEDTPTQEVQTPRPSATAPVLVTVTPTQAPVVYTPNWRAYPNGRDNPILVAPPVFDNGTWEFFIERYAGRVGVEGEFIDVMPAVCYIVTAPVIVNLANTGCETPYTNYRMPIYINYEDDRVQHCGTTMLNNGVGESINGEYGPVCGITFKGHERVSGEVMFGSYHGCSTQGNSVIIGEVRFEVAPDAGYCQ